MNDKSYFHIDPPVGRTSKREEGDPMSKIAILGEAPALQELRQNRPLVGQSGQLLNLCLHEAGLIRRQVYLLNVFSEMVQKDEKTGTISTRSNRDRVLWTKKHGFTQLAESDLRSAQDKLRRSGANIIVTLGATATSALCLDIKSIGKWRGSVILADADSGVSRKVLPTYHPAASLRGMYLWRYDIIGDLKKAKKQSASRQIIAPKTSLILRPSASSALRFMKECKQKGAFNTDTEIYGRNISCFSLAHDIHTSMCIPLIDENGKPCYSDQDEADIWLGYADLMGDPSVTKINQNILFDMWVLWILMNIETRGPVHDPMILQGILYPDFPKKLEYLCSHHADMPYYKDDKKLWKTFWKDIRAFWKYNARDSIASIRSLYSLLDEAREKGYEEQYQDNLDDIPALLYMMCRGMLVDGKELEASRNALDAKLNAKIAELASVADYDFNPASPKQCIQYFYVHKGYKPYVNPKTKKFTVDDLALARIARKHNSKEARVIQDIRRLAKLKGTYLEVDYDDDNRLRCSYNPAVASTGRLSSSQTVFGTGLNMQNLDPEFKTFLIPG